MITKHLTVFLCGFMGCGKSTVGKKLANMMNCEFYDLDEIITRKQGMKIPEIFEKHGEEYFRECERNSLKQFEGKIGVIALGGGTMLSDENAQVVNDTGLSIFIDTPFEACYARIKGDKNRPIAFNSTKQELLERFNQRYPIYKANTEASCNGKRSPSRIAKDILTIVHSH